MPNTLQKSKRRVLSDAAYHEHDFPALRLARAARIVRRLGRALLLLLAVSVLAMVFAPWQQSIRGEGAIVAFDPNERPQPVMAPVKGRVAERGEGIQENAYVKKGQLLFRIEDQDPDYLNRLERQVVIAEAEIEIAKSRLQTAEQARENFAQIVELTSSQITAQRQSLTSLLQSYDALILEARNKLTAAESKLVKAEAVQWQTELDYERKRNLYSEGITSQFKQQETEQKFKSAEAEVRIAKQGIQGAENLVAAKLAEQKSKSEDGQAKLQELAAKREKARGELAKAEIDIKKTSEEIQQKITKLLDQQRKLEAQRTAEVRAPLDGYVMNLAVFNDSSIVKPGDVLCRIVPRTERPAVQVWVSGNDAPLIAKDDHVRLQFEGWPAVQFSGWPSVAVGTFGGKVALVDAADDGFGRFRVVVIPDDTDQPWPDGQYLRQGVRANGWVLLDQVPLGYEVWRRMNGFPPSLKSKEQEKEVKAPKIKV